MVARLDGGLLALRGAALCLLLTFGLGKFVGLVMILASGKPLAASGIARLIAEVGLPLPGLLAAFVMLSESVAALFMAAGFFTRSAAVCGALTMAGAFYYSLHAGEEPLRAFVYLVVFIAVALAGPGRYSIDSWRQR